MADDGGAPEAFAAELASCLESERDLVDWLRDMPDADPAAPSRLPDWTVGHVMTHIARNADGVSSMMRARPQYAHGRDGRNADIEAGSVRSWAELVDDVVASSAGAVVALEGCEDWTGTVEMIVGSRPKAQVPILRQREVEVHRVDLGLGYEFSDLPADYVRRDLRLLEMLWQARQPMGLTALPGEALAEEPATRLAWLMGRGDIDGLAPANLF